MREILFRGKRCDGVWVYGDLVHEWDGRICIYVPSENQIVHWTVDPNTVGQYTGAKDKNGKDIYGADIVICYSYKKEDKKIVTWNNELCGFDPMVTPCDYDEVYYSEYLIIGNIYDNSELRPDR